MGSGNRRPYAVPDSEHHLRGRVLSSVRADTVRARVTSSSGPESIDVEFDLRAMKISEWACATGLASIPHDGPPVALHRAGVRVQPVDLSASGWSRWCARSA